MDMSGQLHAPAALLSGKQSLIPIGKEDRWAPDPVWAECKKKSQPLPAIEPQLFCL